MTTNRENRLKRAQSYARWKAKQLKAQGMENPWPLAIAKAAAALCGNYRFKEFQHDLACMFKSAYWKKINDARKSKQLSLQGV